ncbi:hypothetical protein AVEN_764-1 [Araneus ventricosus]|uniref:Alpha-carbonic anhydrase domain-containing protein n=1 Tax=Araneus ventricosus TaxID=182803 RepID=A0A4Y2LBT3_ARAVE|nr:hypothetical protein AVEN_764-1 [Araneus ventricosus]
MNSKRSFIGEKTKNANVGQEVPLHHVSVQGLLPSTSHFVTYEGSLTVPACHESVTWLVVNRPIYITKQQQQEGYFGTILVMNRGRMTRTTPELAPLAPNFRTSEKTMLDLTCARPTYTFSRIGFRAWNPSKKGPYH